MTFSDALTKTSDAAEPGLALLRHWRNHGTVLWVYVGAHNGGLASVVRAHVTDVSRCLVLKNDAAVFRFDLKNARFRHGPLQAIFTPTDLGRAAVVTQKREGLLGEDGLVVALDSGHSLFIRECPADEGDWQTFTAALDQGIDRLRES